MVGVDSSEPASLAVPNKRYTGDDVVLRRAPSRPDNSLGGLASASVLVDDIYWGAPDRVFLSGYGLAPAVDRS